jgi:hypothetical protein
MMREQSLVRARGDLALLARAEAALVTADLPRSLRALAAEAREAADVAEAAESRAMGAAGALRRRAEDRRDAAQVGAGTAEDQVAERAEQLEVRGGNIF